MNMDNQINIIENLLGFSKRSPKLLQALRYSRMHPLLFKKGKITHPEEFRDP